MDSLLFETPLPNAFSGNLPTATLGPQADASVNDDSANTVNYGAFLEWLAANAIPDYAIQQDAAPTAEPEAFDWTEFLIIPVNAETTEPEPEVTVSPVPTDQAQEAENISMEEIFAMFQQATEGFDVSCTGTELGNDLTSLPTSSINASVNRVNPPLLDTNRSEVYSHRPLPNVNQRSEATPSFVSPTTPSLASPFSKDNSSSPVSLRTPLSTATHINSNSPVRPHPQRNTVHRKPYDRPSKSTKAKLHPSIDSSQYTPAELARIQARSLHKQRKEAHIIDTRNAGTHIEVEAEHACTSCAKYGYDCLVPRLEDLGWGKLVSKLGFCAGCHSNRGDCTFTKRPERRVAAYESAYGQKGFSVHKNGMALVKADASKFTLANLLHGEWKRTVYPM